jgi:hypothetical protein
VDSALVTWTGTADQFSAAVHIPETVRLYPNPVSSAATLIWPDGWTGEALVEIRDLSGRLVGTVSPGTGSSAVLQLGSVPSGIYSVTLRSGENGGTARMVVLH